MMAAKARGAVLQHAFASALAAVRTQWRPLLVLQILVVGIVVSAFLSPGVDQFWKAAGARLESWGLPGVFLAAGFTSGLLAETAIVAMHQGGRWNLANTEDGIFRFVLYGVNAVLVSLFYRLQAAVFGDVAAWSVVLPKLVVDQLLFAPLVCLPLQVGASRFQALRYNAPRLFSELRGPFFRERYLPALMTQWLFWPFVTSMIYLFPLSVQTPLFLLIGATWALLVVALTRRSLA